MWLPPALLLDPLEAALTEAGAEFETYVDQHALGLWIPDSFADLAEVLDKALGQENTSAMRSVYKAGNEPPGWRELAHALPLADLIAAQRALWLLELVEGDRLTSHFQPIVQAGDTSRVFAQEALLRANDREGKLVPPFRMFSAARAAGLLDMLDFHARTTAIKEAAGHTLQSRLFINLNPAAVRNPESDLGPTLELIRKLGLRQDQVVFELVESDHSSGGVQLEELRAFFAREGFKLALDDLGSGYSSLNLIHKLKPDYIKLDMDLIRDVHKDPYKARITRKILELAAELNIETIAEGVETAGELRWLRSHGATYLQGYLIAKPASPPNLAPPALVVVEGPGDELTATVAVKEEATSTVAAAKTVA
jgi:EAL domain-containing protein (putative c-di-GMP-specific phosphodiesterase class I)